MKRTLHLAFAALLCLLPILTGCKTTDHAETGQLASLEISGRSEADILRAVKAVFIANGYKHTKDLTFEKRGSSWDTAAYGGWSSAVWIRLKATVDPTPTGQYVIGCDAYTVDNHDQGVMEMEQKRAYAKRDECAKLLEQVKAKLDSPGPIPDVPDADQP
ncbi:MAG TPA: hypothetical protein VGO57_17505 [Verrucomicrobiae bacterium]|jgi:hypothetical protein